MTRSTTPVPILWDREVVPCAHQRPGTDWKAMTQGVTRPVMPAMKTVRYRNIRKYGWNGWISHLGMLAASGLFTLLPCSSSMIHCAQGSQAPSLGVGSRVTDGQPDDVCCTQTR